MSANQVSKSKDKSNSQVNKTDLSFEVASTDISQKSASAKNEQNNFTPVEVKKKSPQENPTEPIFQTLKAKTAAILLGSTVMLPILAVGTATYYFGTQAVEKQTILAKRGNNFDLAEIELAQQRNLLAALLIGTGTTALLAGGVTAWGTKRLLDKISKISTKETTLETETQIHNLSQSVWQNDILNSIVEEARTYLNCDRVVVYSLNQDKYGVVVAESVVAGYTQALDKTIQDPCFEARYLQKYRDGRVRAINDIDKAEMTPCHKEQLEKLEVKANLVTPIINQGNLFGLLVAHQCNKPRQWQKGEIEFLDQLAKKAGLVLENARLSDDMVRLQTQAERERQWTHYFTDAIQYIRASIKQDDVLDISVEEVRRVLNCDRVVVYSLNQDKYGVVIAESVSPGYPRALNKTISDPCFEARYLDKYRDGRVRAIDNIYEAQMSSCYIEQLETLEVKANLVTPIINEGKLFGLLVAHQCSEARQWQDYEIRWVTQIATQVGFALDNATLLKKLKNEGLPTQLLNNFSLGIREKVNKIELLKIAVEQARKIIKLDRVIVYELDADWNGKILAESVLPGYPRALNSRIKNPCFAQEYGKKYRQDKTEAIANIHQANLTDSHLEQLESLSVKASIIVPILQSNGLCGLLIGHQCQQPRLWESSEIDLFTQLALQLGFALDRVELQEELELAKDSKRDNTEPEQPEQQNLNQKVSQLLRENQAALQTLQSKIDNHSPVTENFIDKISGMTQQVRMITDRDLEERFNNKNTIPELKNTQLANDLTAARKEIAEATKKVEMLNQSHHKLHQMVSLINDLKEEIRPLMSTQPAQLPMGEIIFEANEITSNSINNGSTEANLITGQLVETPETTPSMLLMNQFVGEISNLSAQISQQSLFVTESFQKLATFAKQLSEREES